MFDLDAAVLAWRERVGRRSSLSPREVDELEDHLRARVDLEMELNRGLVPAHAFAMAREGLGDPATLSKEFAKAGKPRWRRLMVAGWALFAVSFFLPALYDPSVAGWEAFLYAVTNWAGLIGVLSALTNLLMLVTILTARRARPPGGRWAFPVMAGASALNLLYWPFWVMTEEGKELLHVGYWAWLASFLCVSAGLWMRERGRASALPAVSAEGG